MDDPRATYAAADTMLVMGGQRARYGRGEILTELLRAPVVRARLGTSGRALVIERFSPGNGSQRP
jgi:hypothetical protein